MSKRIYRLNQPSFRKRKGSGKAELGDLLSSSHNHPTEHPSLPSFVAFKNPACGLQILHEVLEKLEVMVHFPGPSFSMCPDGD
jgi:hypothetical protein